MIKKSNFLEIRDWNKAGNTKPDLMVTTLHGETSQNGSLFKAFPEMKEWLAEDDQPFFSDYLDLDADVYSNELAEAFLTALHEQEPSLFLRWIKVTAHRGVLDCNRMDFEEALRDVFPPDLPDRGKLTSIHLDLLKDIVNAVQGARFIFDLHTMYPYSPREESEFPRLQGYIDRSLSAHGVPELKQPIDVLYADSEGKRYSKGELTNCLLAAFENGGYEVARDIPYSMGPTHLDTKMLMQMAEVTSASLDVPKSLLAEMEPLDKIYRSEDLSQEKVKKMAGILVQAFLVHGFEKSQ